MMNDNFQPFPFIQQKANYQYNAEITNLTNQINVLHQEIRRLERRILNIEKSLIKPPLTELKPTPMEYNNLNYTNDNYIL